MRHGKTFRKRFLTFLLSLAMVLTSVNVPMLTVWAEEETPTVSGNGDETPEEKQAPKQPFGLVVELGQGDNEGKIRVAWGKPDPVDATGWEIYVDDALVKTVTDTDCVCWLENTYSEGKHTVKLYAVNEAGKSDSLDGEFTIPGESGDDDTETKVPSAPSGVDAKYSDDDGHKGDIWVVWNGVFGDGGTPTSWEVYIDGKLVGTENVVAAYYYKNTYAEGTHTVKVIAVNDKGKSDPTTVKFELTKDQAGGTDVDEGSAAGEVLVDSDIDLTELVPGVDATPGTNAGIWSAWTNAGVTAQGAPNSTVTFTYPSGKCANDWALQFQTDESIDIEQGEYYTLTFTAESSIPRQIEVCMGVASTNTRDNDLKYKLPAKQATKVVYVFEAKATAKYKIQFLLGTQQDDKSPLWEQEEGHTLKLSNISLEKGKAVDEVGANASVATNSDKSGLKAAITECDALKAEDYEEGSFEALKDALATAKSVSESDSSTKKEVDDALVDLQIAQASLHESGYVPPADPVTMADPINFEEIEMETYRSQNDGGWGGDSNVEWAYDKTVATITADGFGNPASWAVQWAYKKLESTVDNNVFEFDVVSTVDKSIIFKDENTGNTTTLELKAGETTHYAQRVNKKSFGFTFDLSGGGAGKLTFTNMKYGEEVSYYNFAEQEKAKNVELYVGTDWAGAAADGTATEDSYTISASNFGGGNVWGLQLILHNFIDIKTTATYKIGAIIESTVDKDITIKLGNPDEENDVLALKDISLKANTPQTVELESTLWDEELASALFFACGNKKDVSGDITISKLYVVSKKPTDGEAPVLTTGRKNNKEDGYRIGQAVELLFTAGAEDWAGKITSVKVNNKTLADDKYELSVADHKITIDAGVFTKYDVYDFVITADNYSDAKIRVPVYAASVDNENWEKEWADEFDGTTLDTTKWDYEIGVRSGDDNTSDAPIYWGNNEKEYYTKEAVTVQGGKLVITATALTDDIKEKYNVTDNTVKYASGRIRTVSEDGSEVKYATTYGRIEAMMEMPQATGYWPAFWGLPTPETIDLYGTWATSGELDIMEAVGQDGNYVNGTIHYGSVWPNNVYSGGSHYFEEGDSIANEHLYAVEWEPGEIRWYVDDILYHVENNWYAKAAGASANYAYPAPFDEDFYILLNLAVGGNYVSNQEPGADELGKSMKVDYVRVYKDSNADYGTVPDTPSADRDTEFFEANKQYADESGNYLKDPEFETLKDHQMGAGGTVVPGLGYWNSATDSGNGAATDIAVVEKDGVKYAKIDVLKTGANNYDVQLIQHVPLAQGYTYRLTFDAYTDVAAGRNFAVAPKGDADNGWAGYDSGISPNLKTTVQSFEHIFTMAADSDPTARIEMNIGNALGTVYVGNAKLVALTDQELEDIENDKLHGKKTPLDNGEHIYNGTFDQGNGKLAYWDLDGDYTADTSKRSMKAVINASSDINDATIKQTGLQLLARDTYRLTLDAKADKAKKIKVGLYSKDGVVYAQTQATVNTETGEVVLEFTMPEDVTDEEAVLIIAFGGDTVSVEIDNVSMVRTTNFNAEWNASILYPLGGETWSDYNYYVFGDVTEKAVPADGIVTEAANSSNENHNYMIFRNASVKKGCSYDLSFDIKANVANQKVTASVQQDNTWIVLAEEQVTTDTDWQTVNTTFKATTEGAVNLKFLLADSSNTEYNVSLRNVSLKVVGAPYLVLKNVPSEVLVGAEFQVNASHMVEVNPDYEVYTYSSSNPDVATISESGLVTAVAVGTTTIKVTSGAEATKSFDLTVVAEVSDNANTVLLEAKVTEAERYLSQTDKYTVKSLAELKAAVDVAKAIIDGINNGLVYEQNTVDEAEAAVADAIIGLELKDDYSKVGYRVTFDYNCEIGTKTIDVEPGALITTDDMAEVAAVERDGYSLQAAWYKDAEYKKQWNFETDTVQEDTTLYALWLKETPKAAEGLGASSLIVQEIRPLTYTGSALKPSVIVYANVVNAKGRTERVQLTANKDYKVTYKNNVNVYTGTDPEKETLVTDAAYKNSATKNLWSSRPYVEIKGNGSYSGYVYQEFEIKPADINDAALKYNSQIVEKKATKVVTSLKYKKALKEGADYHVAVTDAEGKPVVATTYKDEAETKLNKAATIAKDALAGNYVMTITGKGNYTGTVTGSIVVAGNAELMQKAAVAVGSKAKKQAWTGKEVELKSAYEVNKSNATTIDGTVMNKNEVYTVKIGKDFLKEGRDFKVKYKNNVNVGTATMILTGLENRAEGAVYCTGTKEVTFQITGTKFAAAGKGSTIVVKEKGEPRTDGKTLNPEDYTGKPVTKSGIVLESEQAGGALVLGKDYNITYKNNLKKGKATVTFTATQRSGFTGKFAMTFQIGAVSLGGAVDDIDGATYDEAKGWTADAKVPYTPAGAKLPEITLKNQNGVALKEKTDYTVTYIKGVNYKQVNEEGVAVTLKGKGNYTGELTVNFKIVPAKADDLTITTKAVQYNERATKNYEPAVTVKNGKTTLKAKGNTPDYKVEYANNTPEAVNAYIAYRNGVEGAEKVDAPTATITMLNDNYDKGVTKTVTLTIFEKSKKLTAKNVKVNFIDEKHYYEGGLPVRPRYTSIMYDPAGKFASGTDEKWTDLADASSKSKEYVNREYLNYDITWGANNKTGNGTMKITGKGIYTGTVTVKFKIEKKPVNRKVTQNLIVDKLTYDWYIDALIQADLVEAVNTVEDKVKASYNAANNTATIGLKPEARNDKIKESIDKWIADNETGENKDRLNDLRWDAQNAFEDDLKEAARIELKLDGSFEQLNLSGGTIEKAKIDTKTRTIENPGRYAEDNRKDTATPELIKKVKEKYAEMYDEMVAKVENKYGVKLDTFGNAPRVGDFEATATIVYKDGTTMELTYTVHFEQIPDTSAK
ncbi:MAG: family 16 glycosylhydrolase [Lachnospiraceae bacterium]|nr:family 16 glycosylhydrolase [Lachnospiraceae bacterium]